MNNHKEYPIEWKTSFGYKYIPEECSTEKKKNGKKRGLQCVANETFVRCGFFPDFNDKGGESSNDHK